MFIEYIMPMMVVIIWLCVGIMGAERFIDEGGDAIGWVKLPFSVKLLVVIVGPILMLGFEFKYVFRNEDIDLEN